VMGLSIGLEWWAQPKGRASGEGWEITCEASGVGTKPPTIQVRLGNVEADGSTKQELGVLILGLYNRAMEKSVLRLQ
ncbi:MAG: hypothetical protein AAB875_03730, partial [Patescibacteria group bacterium]